MTRLQQIRRQDNLVEFAGADGFVYAGDGLILFFIKHDGQEVQRNFTLCNTAREARREVKAREVEGWRCCWKVYGRLHLPERLPGHLTA